MVAVLPRREHPQEHVDLGVRVAPDRPAGHVVQPRSSIAPAIRANSSRPSRSARTPGSRSIDRRISAGVRSVPTEPAERVRHRLAPLGEPLVDHREQRHRVDVDRRRPGVEPDQHRVDLRARPEHVGRHPAEHAGVRPVRDPNAHRAVRLLTRTRDEPVPHLPLHHHDVPVDRRGLQLVEQQRHGDVVGQVRDHRPASGAERGGPVGPHRVGDVDPHVRVGADDLGERSRQPAVDLDREDLGPGLGERDGQGPEPGPDLHDAVPVLDPGVRHDGPSEVGVGEEVLAPDLGRPDPVARREVLQLGAAETVRTLTS